MVALGRHAPPDSDSCDFPDLLTFFRFFLANGPFPSSGNDADDLSRRSEKLMRPQPLSLTLIFVLIKAVIVSSGPSLLHHFGALPTLDACALLAGPGDIIAQADFRDGVQSWTVEGPISSKVLKPGRFAVSGELRSPGSSRLTKTCSWLRTTGEPFGTPAPRAQQRHLSVPDSSAPVRWRASEADFFRYFVSSSDFVLGDKVTCHHGLLRVRIRDACDRPERWLPQQQCVTTPCRPIRNEVCVSLARSTPLGTSSTRATRKTSSSTMM